MDDISLNRAVAEARGWTQEEGHGLAGAYMLWLDSDGRPVNDVLVLVASSPAAWGALFEELKECPMLEYDGLGTYTARVGGCVAVASSVGRALGMAFLKSKEKE